MGILGVIVGVLLVIPILGPPIVQFFWLVALALIFLDRWPGGGRGPAWESGEAIPWPTAVEARAAAAGGSAPAPAARREPPRWLQRLGAAAPADENGSGTPQPAPLDDYENDGAPAGTPHPRSKKRKRKRRR
jgi:hypothetical protein